MASGRIGERGAMNQAAPAKTRDTDATNQVTEPETIERPGGGQATTGHHPAEGVVGHGDRLHRPVQGPLELGLRSASETPLEQAAQGPGGRNPQAVQVLVASVSRPAGRHEPPCRATFWIG